MVLVLSREDVFIIKLINQFGIILIIWIVSEYISILFKEILFVPAPILGLIILFLLLKIKLLKLKMIDDVSDFFLRNIAFFFIPIGLSVINYLGILKINFIPILFIGIIITIITMITSIKIIDLMIDIKNGGDTDV